MEQVEIFLGQNLPEIVVIAINIICYILYFVIRLKVKKSGTTLHTLVKEKVVYIDKENATLKQSVQEEINKLLQDLLKANKYITELEKRVAITEKHIEKSDAVIKSIIEENIQ